MLGARLHIDEDASRKPRTLLRALRCYEAEAVVRADESSAPADPFWLAEGRVRVSLRHEASAVVIELRAVPDIERPRLLQRAQEYAAHRG